MDSGDSSASVPAVVPLTLCQRNASVDNLEKETIKQLFSILPLKGLGSFLSYLHKETKEKENWKGNGKELPSHTKAVAWGLNTFYTKALLGENKTQVGYTEALLGENKRQVVPSNDIAQGGDFRAVVKMDVQFTGGKIYHGTGFVINESTVVTAGHLVFDNVNSYATTVLIRAGVDGSSGNVETRVGTYTVVAHGWYANRSTPNDLAFIRLKEPFASVNPMKIDKTPTSGKGTVYGYPGDIHQGTKLCKASTCFEYTGEMVEHRADTMNGNSGGPVLDEKEVAIAVHRGWDRKGKCEIINHAVAINRAGNDFAAFSEVLAYMAKGGPGIGDVKFMIKEEGFDGFAFAW